MAFWSQPPWFERSGERYVFRPTVLSRGYDVSESEKDQLFRGLTRLNRRLFCEGLAVLAAVAALLMSGAIGTANPLPWFVLFGLLGVGVLAATGLARRDRLIARVLEGRPPDVPRLALRGAVAAPQPSLSKRHAVLLLRSVVFLFCLCLATVDGVAVYLLYLAHAPAGDVARPGGQAGDGAHVAGMLSSPGFWIAFGAFNALLVACAFLLAREVRRLSRLPERGPFDGPARTPDGRGRV